MLSGVSSGMNAGAGEEAVVGWLVIAADAASKVFARRYIRLQHVPHSVRRTMSLEGWTTKAGAMLFCPQHKAPLLSQLEVIRWDLLGC